MGVSKNIGTPKWMVKIMVPNPMNKWMIFLENHYFLLQHPSICMEILPNKSFTSRISDYPKKTARADHRPLRNRPEGGSEVPTRKTSLHSPRNFQRVGDPKGKFKTTVQAFFGKLIESSSGAVR